MSTVSSHTDLINETTLQGGKYRITDVLGRGGFGITYLAEHKAFGKVALKELFLNSGNVHCTRENTTHKTVIPHFDTAQFEQFRQRFEEEARTLFNLSDIEGVVKVLDIFEENGTSYFSMEFLDGEKLDEYIHRKNPSVTEGVNIINALGKTLSAIHLRKVLHRDIKPSNIIVTKTGRIVLIDFGIARSYTDDMPDTHTTFHSPRFAPPEQKVAKNRMGEFSDVYSLGATAYYVFSKQPPQSIEERITEDYTPPQYFEPSLPEHVSAAIERSLAIKSDKRFQTIDAFLAALNGDSNESKPKEIEVKTAFFEEKKPEPIAIVGNETLIETTKPTPLNTSDNTAILEQKPLKIKEKTPINSKIKKFLWPAVAAVALGIATVVGISIKNSGQKENTTVGSTQIQPLVVPTPTPSVSDTSKLVNTTSVAAPNTATKPTTKKPTSTKDKSSETPSQNRGGASETTTIPTNYNKTTESICTSDVKYANVEIWNASGVMIDKYPVNDKREIDIGHLAKGRYTLKCTRGADVICSKNFNVNN